MRQLNMQFKMAAKGYKSNRSSFVGKPTAATMELSSCSDEQRVPKIRLLNLSVLFIRTKKEFHATP